MEFIIGYIVVCYAVSVSIFTWAKFSGYIHDNGDILIIALSPISVPLVSLLWVADIIQHNKDKKEQE